MATQSPLASDPYNRTEGTVYSNGLRLHYESLGDTAAPTILLIMGLGMQLTAWPDPFCEALVRQGFRVVRFDNRDAGLSTKADWLPIPNVPMNALRHRLGLSVEAGYTLHDMARDTAGLLDALGIFRAHVVGASMGGMIGQTLASHFPDRVLTLTSIMSSTGCRRLPGPTTKATRALLSKPKSKELEAIVEHQIKVFGILGSPGFPIDPEERRREIRRNIQRSRCVRGIARQMAAIFASGDRSADLAHIRCPTLVIHGAQDPLLPLAAGRDTAAKIANATLHIIEGMGHDMAAWPVIAEAITAHAGSNR